ncbi:S-layer homology domain-containing protein [Qingrenia yutianensis]|uniref:S-layer homology domain-containing protein n=1 Tax=Qingrenia yutianensis TaxID=2763676 RepID=A0A926FB65_9FIRM|nr:S-layer homology domain-containing protein [Qingrenia yutianensis]MBC8597275.1 S-layer homology domain-containing protein [Qingrenia yutianensis]
MKKIIFSLLCIMMLCTSVTFAAETETVGGTITLTQFLGASREDVKSVAITINAKTDYVDKNAFYDISDSLMLTSAFEPELITLEGTYITVEKTDGSISYAFIGQSGGVDRYSALMSRMPYALYTTENPSAVMSLINSSNDTDFNDIKNHWAKDTIEKWKDKGVISGYPDGTFKPDNPITRAELAKILTLAFYLQERSPLGYEDVKSENWYYSYLERCAKYIPVYPLPVSYETNTPYQEVTEKGLNYYLPETPAMRIHVAEALVEIKKDKEQINTELPSIQDIQANVTAAFKDDDYENLYAMHGTIPENVTRMFEYTYLANKLGIMQGDTDGYFRPYDSVTRAELITMLDRMTSTAD